MADDMGCGDIGALGNPDVQTPHLDRMAAEGVRLTQHHSGSPMCAPARAAFLTGRYPHRSGAIDVVECKGLDRIALRETTIADLLKARGYATGMVGKWHNGAVDPRYHPNARGFDEFAGFRGGFIDYWDWVLDYNGALHRADGRYLTDVFTEEAVGFIERHRARPFFLCVTYNAPHTPLQAPDEDVRPFLDSGKFNRAVSTIYGMNRRMDKGVGRIVGTLDRLGLSENTLVLFTSDNGPMFVGEGETSTRRFNLGLNGHKELVLEGGIRVPAIVRWPAGLPAGAEVPCLVHFADWLPTLLAAAGGEAHGDLPLDGRDVTAALRGDGPGDAPPRFWQWNRYAPVANCNAAMRDGPWKLHRPAIPEALRKPRVDNERSEQVIYHPEQVRDIWRDPVERDVPEPGPPMLFNLAEDPGEQRDVAGLHPGRAEAMQRELERWWASVLADLAEIADENLAPPT